MDRRLPTVRSDAWYHVVNRGLDGSALFPADDAASVFLAALGEVAAGHPVEINAYCVMGNHYHLLVRADEDDLRPALGTLESGVAGRPGRPRLRRLAMGRHLLQVTRYIHLNPVEARLCPRPQDWRWSSYRGYLNPLDAPPWLRCDAVLGWLGSFGTRERYRRFVEGWTP